LLLSFYLNVYPPYTANKIKDNEEPLFQLKLGCCMAADEFPASYWSQESSSRLPIGHSFIMFYKRKEDFSPEVSYRSNFGNEPKKMASLICVLWSYKFTIQ
jgi:hypothetical protein